MDLYTWDELEEYINNRDKMQEQFDMWQEDVSTYYRKIEFKQTLWQSAIFVSFILLFLGYGLLTAY